ncbi:M36 family metallopeptidase [Nocardioides sp. DS6]|uniref:M36 family metallopeptidase n=1 Tax=Nocardioides eburneus TaxID=3231482 RepID=A0ABV3T2W1_9ACTN
MKRSLTRPLAAAAVGSTVVLALLSAPGAPADAAPGGRHDTDPRPGAFGAGSVLRAPGDFDNRELGALAKTKAERSIAQHRGSAATDFVIGLGPQGIADIDPLTRTVRQLTRLDGYLTAPTGGDARSIALGFVRSHLGVLGLTEADLKTLVFRQDYVDETGLHNLSWTQEYAGTPVFGNGLIVRVTSDGRVLSVSGSPVTDLAAEAAQATRGSLSADTARQHAAANVRGKAAGVAVASRTTGAGARTTWKNHDYAQKVWFLTPQGLRLGWSTYTQTGADAAYQHVIDASSGKALYRHSTVADASASTTLGFTGAAARQTTPSSKPGKTGGHTPTKPGHKPGKQKSTLGQAYVYDYYPGAPKGGKARLVDLVKKGWLSKKASFLDGTTVRTWADVNDNDAIDAGETTPVPGADGKAGFALQPFDSSALCSAAFVCTWDENTPYSWRTNMSADATNAFYLASNYHDYLASDHAIAFTRRAGNFEAKDGDPVLQQVLDGADTADGLPDSAHDDNANMNTPPDGTPPTMQMYLWKSADGFTPTSGAFDASVLLHEYTHGLSNRLVVDADGNSTLNSLQAGAMGEAWSDYYAMDYLVTSGFQKDTRADGEVFEGQYLMGGQKDADGNPVPFRSMAIDCPVGSSSPSCVNTYNPGATPDGGYTYGDLVDIGGSAEVHSSGEVWAQTLWDLRKAFGHSVADTIITRGMSLSAADPSMLDMRNGILQADLVAFHGKHTAQIWKIFANRGMGFYAGSVDGADTAVAEDFHTPPPASAGHGTVTGIVTNTSTGDPVVGAVVKIAGLGDQYAAVTDATGRYTLGAHGNLPPGTYPKVVVSGPGYLPEVVSITVTKGQATTHDFAIERDWAASAGGASVTSYDGPDYSSYGCGPSGAIDMKLGSGWGSTSGDDAGDPTDTFVPKSLVIELPQAVDVSAFEIAPDATCGDDIDSATGDYTIEVSPDGTAWTTVKDDHLGLDTQGQLNSVTPDAPATGVKFVRFTIQGNQLTDAIKKYYGQDVTFAQACDPTVWGGYFGGCAFTDLTEVAVLGTPSA